MKITFAEEGWSEYLYWQMRDKKILKRINQLLQNIERDGALHGIGKPEPLKYGKLDMIKGDDSKVIFQVWTIFLKGKSGWMIIADMLFLDSFVLNRGII